MKLINWVCNIKLASPLDRCSVGVTNSTLFCHYEFQSEKMSETSVSFSSSLISPVTINIIHRSQTPGTSQDW